MKYRTKFEKSEKSKNKSAKSKINSRKYENNEIYTCNYFQWNVRL